MTPPCRTPRLSGRLLLAQAPSLMPTSEAPNVALSAPHIVLGNVALDGDYVFLQTSLLETSGAFSTPTHDISELFVHLLPYTANQDMGIDISYIDYIPGRTSFEIGRAHV